MPRRLKPIEDKLQLVAVKYIQKSSAWSMNLHVKTTPRRGYCSGRHRGLLPSSIAPKSREIEQATGFRSGLIFLPEELTFDIDM